MGATPMILQPSDGQLVVHDGWEALVKLAGNATDGALTILETRHEAGSSASAHIHSRESETFLVLEGTFTFRLGEERVELGPGGIAFGPLGTIHGFEAGISGGRLLHVFVPSGMEGFFTAPRVRGVDLRREYGVESVGQ
jgi:quercetin dioxygenase-like cupin family protein